MNIVKINSDFIKLDQFLKWAGVVESGVMAKHMVLDGIIKVNGEIEERRGRKERQSSNDANRGGYKGREI